MLLIPFFFGWLLASGASPQGTDHRDEKGRLESEIARGTVSDLAKWSAEKEEKQDGYRDFLEAFRIEDAGDGCLAYDRAREDCAVTISEFNNSGTRYQLQPQADTSAPDAFQAYITRARGVMLRALLESRFLASRLDDSLQVPDFRERWQSDAGRGIPYAKAEQDTALQRLYRKYFAAHFRGRDSLVVHFLAATDSSLLDSLWRTDPGNPSCREGGAQNPETVCRGKTRLAWRKFAWQLPESLQRSIERLPPGKASGPFRLPFGYFLLKPVQRVNIPERSFRECLPLLIEISNLKQISGSDGKATLGLVTKPAAANEKFTVWLWPAPRLGKTDSGRARSTGVPDTLKCKPLRLSREEMPSSIRNSLDRIGPLHYGDFIPFHGGEFGVMALRMDKPESTFRANPQTPAAIRPKVSLRENEETLFALAQERLRQKSVSKDLGRFRTRMQDQASATQVGSRYDRELGDWISANIEILSRL